MTVLALLSLLAALVGFPSDARAEIVERDLGTNAEGEPVRGYVFQAGSGFRRGASISRLGPRVSGTWRRPRGIEIDRGYGYGFSYCLPLYSGYPALVLPYHFRSSRGFVAVPHRFQLRGGSYVSIRIGP